MVFAATSLNLNSWEARRLSLIPTHLPAGPGCKRRPFMSWWELLEVKPERYVLVRVEVAMWSFLLNKQSYVYIPVCVSSRRNKYFESTLNVCRGDSLKKSHLYCLQACRSNTSTRVHYIFCNYNICCSWSFSFLFHICIVTILCLCFISQYKRWSQLSSCPNSTRTNPNPSSTLWWEWRFMVSQQTMPARRHPTLTTMVSITHTHTERWTHTELLHAWILC